MKFQVERLAVFLNILIPVSFLFSWHFFSFQSIFTLSLLFLLLLNFYCRHIQKAHTLLANFGILAFFRYFLESIGPEFRQYLYSSDTEEKPFNRIERRDVYIKAKNEGEASAFGSLLDFRNRPYTLKHSFYPQEKDRLEKFSLSFGEERNSKKSYKISKPLLIGGMSYGALGKHAVRALARGAKKAGLTMNTGEGGYPKYHLMEACDLIFQIGTGKFGVRKENGDFDPDKLSALSQKKEIKMIEIKFSQGAKPGKGGLLPKEKITEEIAELRNIPLGKDLYSPPHHKECHSALSTVHFIKQIQEISQLPVGIKFCLGREKEIYELFSVMKKEKSFPDYIAIDGSEGGTGAAPKTFMDDLG
ncbi:MAG: FMN-binding glutamate synthase family protein, partial [Oligoflexia bacterium]|nr:FMN-binding glutamate synthase family protein [Oligoflexia bacterium]